MAWIVDSIRNSLAEIFIDKVISLNLGRLSAHGPFSAAVLVVTYQFFLFGVHGNDRAASCLERFDCGGDVFKLPVSVGMLLALETLSVALKAIVAGLEESADGIGGNSVALAGEFAGQLDRALA